VTSPLGSPRQIAFAVPDVSAETIETWSTRLGAGPFVTAEHIELSSCEMHGRPAVFDHSSAYGQWGELMVELVVEHQRERIGASTGVHHLAFLVDSLERGIRHCSDRGWPIALDATTRGGQRFVMCDARGDLGHLIEMYEPSEGLLAFYVHVRRLAESSATHGDNGA